MDEQVDPLLDAVLAIGEDLELEGVLDRVVRAAASLLGARYAALGVLSSDGATIATFLHQGIDEETAARIGDLPSGRGVLGEVIRHPVPLRVDGLDGHPAHVPLPPGHPPMATFIGVPVRVGDEVFGNLYLTEKDGGFTAADERQLVGLAAVAGSSIRNARTVADLARRERWRGDLASLATAVLGGAPEGEVFELVAEATRGALDVAGAAVVLPGPRGRLAVEAAAGDVPEDVVRELAVVAAVRGRSHPGWAGGAAVPLRLGDVDAGAFGGALVALGAVTELHGTRPLLEEVAAQTELLARYARAREAGDRLVVADERARIARDLHDTTVQRVFAAGLRLDAIARRLVDQDELRGEVEATMDELDEAIRSLRGTIGELGRPVEVPASSRVERLVEGLRTVVPGLAPLELEGGLDGLDPGLLADLQAVLREGITNAARHARATTVTVRVVVSAATLVCEVVDDGGGPSTGVTPTTAGGLGLANLESRAVERGGTSDLSSRPTGGAVLRWSVPRPG